MFRFNEPTKEWKERGTGDVRFLRHKVTNKVRVLMRAEKTLRVRANHPLTTSLELKPHAGSDRAFTYFTPDWSEDPETGIIEQRNELFAFRFANPESKASYLNVCWLQQFSHVFFLSDATKFKDTFEKCGKGDFTGLEVIKQDAEDAAKAAEDSKKEEKKADWSRTTFGEALSD